VSGGPTDLPDRFGEGTVGLDSREQIDAALADDEAAIELEPDLRPYVQGYMVTENLAEGILDGPGAGRGLH
jgi:hypothetical protein